ncbi:MAG: sodium/solute symporter [Planctomycetes bacterium]|nr:sodium/solute symporter [Planctomycetota bacterium]
MHFVDWLIVLVINGAVIGYGFYLARGTKSSSDWFLAGRALPWWAIGFSMFATNVDSADIVSVTGKTYFAGLHIITVYAIGSGVGGILAAFWIVPRIYRAGFYTNSEYLESRFGTTSRILSALIQIQYRSSMLGLMIYASYLLLTLLTGMPDTVVWLLIVSLVILAGVYTAWGGLKSVVWTDTVQGVIMLVAAVVIFAVVFSQVGGWTGMQDKFAEMDAADQTSLSKLPHIGAYNGVDEGESPFPWGLGPFIVVIAWTIIASGYWTVNHTQTMRLMGARSLWDMKMAAVWGVLLSLPIMVMCACLGIFGRALVPDISLVEGISKADEMYPYLANKFLIPGAKGLVVAGVVAAAMSTFDSMGSALSAVFTRDKKALPSVASTIRRKFEMNSPDSRPFSVISCTTSLPVSRVSQSRRVKPAPPVRSTTRPREFRVAKTIHPSE